MGWLDGTERAKLKEFTTFAVPRSVLPELQISFLPSLKNVPGPYSEHFLDKIGHQEGVLTLKKTAERR